MRQQIRRARAADDADDLVAFLEQQLGEVGSVLPGDSGDKGAFGHPGSGDSLKRSEDRLIVWAACHEVKERDADALHS